MPILIYAFRAGEFLDEELDYNYIDGYEIYNSDSLYPFEWWSLA